MEVLEITLGQVFLSEAVGSMLLLLLGELTVENGRKEELLLSQQASTRLD